MSFLTTFIITFIVLAIAGTITYVVFELRKLKEHPIGTTTVINHLNRFNNGHISGRIIGKPIPLGKDKKLRRVTYRTSYMDEQGEEKFVYETIIVHQNNLVETSKLIQILPMDVSDVDPTLYHAESLKKLITKNKDFDALAEGMENSTKKLSRVFTENVGGQAMLQILMALQKEQEKKKEEEPEKKDEKKK